MSHWCPGNVCDAVHDIMVFAPHEWFIALGSSFYYPYFVYGPWFLLLHENGMRLIASGCVLEVSIHRSVILCHKSLRILLHATQLHSIISYLIKCIFHDNSQIECQIINVIVFVQIQISEYELDTLFHGYMFQLYWCMSVSWYKKLDILLELFSFCTIRIVIGRMMVYNLYQF